MKKLLIILAFIPLFGISQHNLLPISSGNIISFNNTSVIIPASPPSITYNFNPDDSLLVSLSNTLYGTDTLDFSVNQFNTLATLVSGTFQVDVDSGFLGTNTTNFKFINTKDNSNAQMGMERNMRYRVEFDFYQKTLASNNRIFDQNSLGFYAIETSGFLQTRFSTENGTANRYGSSTYSIDTWYDDFYILRDNNTGLIDINSETFTNNIDGIFPYLAGGYYSFMNRKTGSQGFDGWVRNFKMYNLGETSTLTFNVKSDSSTIYLDPNKFHDDNVLTHPFPNVAKFTGGGTHGEYNMSKIDIEFTIPNDYRSVSNEALYVDNEIEGDAYIRIGYYNNNALVLYSDTINGQPSWDYSVIKRDKLTIRDNSNRYSDWMNYATPDRGQKAKISVFVFCKNGASVSLRNVGLRYKSNTTASTTEYAAANYTLVSLGTPNTTISFGADLQNASASDVTSFTRPFVDTASQYSDYFVAVGDMTDSSRVLMDSTAQVIKDFFPNSNTACIGNHDNYSDASKGDFTKTLFKAYCDTLGINYYSANRAGDLMIHTIYEIDQPVNDIYIIGGDNVDPQAIYTDLNSALEKDTTWTVQTIDSILTVDPNALIIPIEHYPLAQHESSSITDGGQTDEPTSIFRRKMSQYPQVVGIPTGHRNLYGGTMEENGMFCGINNSVVFEAGHPINILYCDVFDNYVRWSWKLHGGTPISANGSGSPNSSFDLGIIYNQYSIYDDWMSFVVPINRTITDNSFLQTR